MSETNERGIQPNASSKGTSEHNAGKKKAKPKSANIKRAGMQQQPQLQQQQQQQQQQPPQQQPTQIRPLQPTKRQKRATEKGKLVKSLTTFTSVPEDVSSRLISWQKSYRAMKELTKAINSHDELGVLRALFTIKENIDSKTIAPASLLEELCEIDLSKFSFLNYEEKRFFIHIVKVLMDMFLYRKIEGKMDINENALNKFKKVLQDLTKRIETDPDMAFPSLNFDVYYIKKIVLALEEPLDIKTVSATTLKFLGDAILTGAKIYFAGTDPGSFDAVVSLFESLYLGVTTIFKQLKIKKALKFIKEYSEILRDINYLYNEDVEVQKNNLKKILASFFELNFRKKEGLQQPKQLMCSIIKGFSRVIRTYADKDLLSNAGSLTSSGIDRNIAEKLLKQMFKWLHNYDDTTSASYAVSANKVPIQVFETILEEFFILYDLLPEADKIYLRNNYENQQTVKTKPSFKNSKGVKQIIKNRAILKSASHLLDAKLSNYQSLIENNRVLQELHDEWTNLSDLNKKVEAVHEDIKRIKTKLDI